MGKLLRTLIDRFDALAKDRNRVIFLGDRSWIVRRDMLEQGECNGSVVCCGRSQAHVWIKHYWSSLLNSQTQVVEGVASHKGISLPFGEVECEARSRIK